MVVFRLATVAILGLDSAGFAGDDPSIEGNLRANIHKEMADYVADSLVDSVYVIYDGTEGKLLRLKFGAPHSGIVKKAGSTSVAPTSPTRPGVSMTLTLSSVAAMVICRFSRTSCTRPPGSNASTIWNRPLPDPRPWRALICCSRVNATG